MKKILVLCIVFLVYFGAVPVVFAQTELTIDPSMLISDAQLLDQTVMSREDLRLFLTRGALASYKTTDAGGLTKFASDIIYDAAIQFNLNPQFLLVLLQREQSLIEDKTPSQDQLDWAMGYAVCDVCSKSDQGIQKFRGFGNQVFYTAKRIRDSFLFDLYTRGKTETGVGPGIASVIDGQNVIPTNFATSTLFSYTPHLLGNLNFAKIWNRWFNQTFPNGSLLQNKNTDEIWLIQNEKKRLIVSRATLLSRFNSLNIIQVGNDLLERYDTGPTVRFPNYSLLRSPRGNVYLIVDDLRRGFISLNAFHASGFQEDEISNASWDDLSAYAEGDPITANTKNPQGILLQDIKTGGVFYIENGQKHAVISRELLNANFYNPRIRSTELKILNEYVLSSPILFPDGTLVGRKGSPEVFVIENAKRRPIADAATFVSFGWDWKQIVWTDERSVLLQPLGDILSTQLDAEIKTAGEK